MNSFKRSLKFALVYSISMFVLFLVIHAPLPVVPLVLYPIYPEFFVRIIQSILWFIPYISLLVFFVLGMIINLFVSKITLGKGSSKQITLLSFLFAFVLANITHLFILETEANFSLFFVIGLLPLSLILLVYAVKKTVRIRSSA